MNITVISGSHRHDSQSGRVGRYIVDQLGCLPEPAYAELLDLAAEPLPLWDEGIWSGDAHWMAILQPLSQRLQTADGFVIVTPEWHGMVPSALKNFLLMWTKQELAHKPALLVSVSAGHGGAYPIAELRMSGYKNNLLCYLPNHVIVRHVNSVLHNVPNADIAEEDQKIRARLVHSLQVLTIYSEAFKAIRSSEAIDLHRFTFGM